MIRELAPGIILYKEPPTESNIPDAIGLFIWKVEVTAMSTVDIELSLKGSVNIQMINCGEDMQTVIQLQPFEKKEICKIAIYEGWKIQTKFKLTLSVPDKEIQQKFIIDDNNKISKLKEECSKKLNLVPLELLNQEEIEDIFYQNQIKKFVDFNFPPIDDAILETKPGQSLRDNFEYLIHWKRPEQFILLENTEYTGISNPNINIFNGNEPEPNDVHLGLMENANLASALSGLAEKYNLINRIILSKKSSKYGIYQVNLWINGQPKTVIIDDLFPCIPMNNPIVTRSPSNEIWVLIIEKALAKIIGSYSSLIFLSIIEILLMLTGCPTFFYEINELIKDDDPNPLLNKLKMFVEDNKYLTMAIMNKNEQEEEENDTSLVVPTFGYTILGIYHLKEDILIKLRKIWFNEVKERNMKDYQEKIIENYPEIKDEISSTEVFVTLGDFVKEFAVLAVCYTKNWEEIRLKGKFTISKENKDSLYNTCVSKNFYYLQVKSKTNLIVSLFQDEDFFKAADSVKPIMDISLSILKYNNTNGEISHIQTLDFSHAQSLQQELNLEAGHYFVIPRSSGCFMCKKEDSHSQMEDKLYDHINDKLSKIFSDVLKDIFNNLDSKNQKILPYESFKGIYENITKNSLSKQDFENNILKNFQSYEKGLTEKGFISFFEYCYKQSYSQNIIGFLVSMGYNNQLSNKEFRGYNIIFHSNNNISVSVRDSFDSQIITKLNNIILKNFGEVKEKLSTSENIKIILVKSKLSNIITLGCKNISNRNLNVKLSFANLGGVTLLSDEIMEKVVKAKEVEYFCQFCVEEEEFIEELAFDLEYN